MGRNHIDELLATHKHLMQPYMIHVIQPIKGFDLTYEQRLKSIQEAGFNTFLLKANDIIVDLLTDSGTSSMTTEQKAGMERGDEAYAGSSSYYYLEETWREVYFGDKNFDEFWFLPTHQGRMAEFLMSSTMIEKEKGKIYVPKNMYFTTTKVHIEKAGGTFVDVIVDVANDPYDESPWKGNIDLQKLQKLVDEVGAEKIAYLHLEGCVNMAGGQPCSMKNYKEIREFCNKHHIPFMLDATRFLENAYFIQQRDPEYRHKSVKEIYNELMRLCDGMTMSSKKDNMVNIGGFVALRKKKEWEGKYNQMREMLVTHDGFPTYGGLAGYSMEALAEGMKAMVATDSHVEQRIKQTQLLGQIMTKAGIPVVRPYGGHAIFVVAKNSLHKNGFVQHIPDENYPAQSLAAATYLFTGVRAMERGRVSKGRDQQGNEYTVPLETVRFTLPRYRYTNDQIAFVGNALTELYQHKDAINGIEWLYEPSLLRFFFGTFKPANGKPLLNL